ncbi:uncharacterized protein LOC126381268 isoform X1 [Pectinophora gossypiella]|uniref:uncharacterized protein LOC126381108 isoform X2 n=2 Tax=Pectinophora gossypiella TaxID=13191 RepID=UPI00214E3240|nr:uncharacterized protein LOC126381108 isoform X2 [Pectinophora gossypiella]XP_049886723.1 uncharacterized protein LOC126381268 isoform X1 [Pectinophora gossypiella]
MTEQDNFQELQQLKQQRSSLKGKLTRICNFIQSYSATNNTLHEIKARQAELEKIFIRFDELQSAIECCECDDPERQEIYEQERQTFEDKYYLVKSKMDALLTGPIITARLSTDHQQLSSTLNHDTMYKKPRVKLPQLELPRFDGDIRQWPAFKNIFMASVDDTDIPVVNKLQYLKSSLTGEAAILISSLLVTEENYTKAMEILSRSHHPNPRCIRKVDKRSSSPGRR